jgi:hypothetical protein
MPRPVRSPELAIRIYTLIAGGLSLRKIGKLKDCPSPTFVYEWLAEDAVFASQYALAREVQAEKYADDIAAIADDESLSPESRRIRIDARKWLAGKLKPKIYGDRLDVAHSGGVGFGLTIHPRQPPKLVEDQTGDLIAIHPRRLVEPHE